MSSGLFQIVSVTPVGGSPPQYALIITSQPNIVVEDHIGTRITLDAGAIYRVTTVNSDTSIVVSDDLTEFRETAFGAPNTGLASFGTPEPSNNFTQLPFNSPGWDAMYRRNFRITDQLTGIILGGLGSVLAGSNTTSGNNIVVSSGDIIDFAAGANYLASGVTSSDVFSIVVSDVNLTSAADVDITAASIINFRTSAADRWSVTAAGHFIAAIDDTYDIGAGGATRPRRVHVATEVVVGDTITIGTDSIVGSTVLTVGAGAVNDFTLQARGGSITLNEAGNTILAPSTTFSSASLIGSINELRTEAIALAASIAGSNELSEILAFGNITGGNNIIVSTGDEITSVTDLTLNAVDELFFATSSVNRWSVDADGDLLAIADNVYDIGSANGTNPGVNRPRSVYVGTELVVGDATVSITTDTITVGPVGGRTTILDDAITIGTLGSGNITVPGTGTNSEQFGDGATAVGNNSTVIGAGAVTTDANATVIGAGASSGDADDVVIGYLASSVSAGGLRSVVIGSNAIATSGYAVAIGFAVTAVVNCVAIGGSVLASNGTAVGSTASVTAPAQGGVAVGRVATCTNTLAIAIGDSTDATGDSSIALGGEAQATHDYSMAVGRRALTTAIHQLVLGGPSSAQGYYDALYVGRGVEDASPSVATTLATTSTPTGVTDVSGSSWIVASGKGTGISTVSSITFQTPDVLTSGSVQQSLATRIVIQEGSVEFFEPITINDDLTLVGDLLFNPDDTWDVGSANGTEPGVNRPRKIFVGTSVEVGTTTGSTAVGDIQAGDGSNELVWNATAGTFGTSAVNGQSWNVQFASTELTGLSGATATATSLIPAGSMVVGITTRVTTAVTGATSFDVGDVVDIDRWGAAIAITLGTTSDPTDFVDNTLQWQTAAAGDVILTANGSDFVSGAVRVSVAYISLVAPTD